MPHLVGSSNYSFCKVISWAHWKIPSLSPDRVGH